MTFADLKSMLQQDVNRADKESVWYPIWINRALRKIQTDSSFSWMHNRVSVVIPSGSSSVGLPVNFKELTAELYPITILDPSLTTPANELPCELMSREKLITYRASVYIPNRPANIRGRLDGLPVWIEILPPAGWALNVFDVSTENLNFRVSYYGFLPDLSADTDTNFLVANYPDLVENKIKAIAFQSINDPIAMQFEQQAAKLLAEAVLDDQRRGRRGRPLRMGG